MNDAIMSLLFHDRMSCNEMWTACVCNINQNHQLYKLLFHFFYHGLMILPYRANTCRQTCQERLKGECIAGQHSGPLIPYWVTKQCSKVLLRY